MLAPVTHFLPVTTIRRERLLPQPGKVIVRAGQKVTALDVIAETNLELEYQLLDIAHILHVSQKKSDRYLQCEVGDQLSSGDLIAGPVGISNRVVRAQKNCKVILAGDGQVLLESSGKPFQLKAGIPGDVVELVPDRGAIVETTGALVQAVWGNGQMDFGVMSVLAKQPDHTLTIADLDVSLRGSIVLSGYCGDVETLKMTDELPLRGLILGSMEAELLPLASKMHFPIVLIEGFGKLPMNPVVFKLLTTNDRREVALNAEAWNQYARPRPEIVIPLPAPGNTEIAQESVEFAPEKQVRVLRSPSEGKIGTIVKMVGSVNFPGGLRSPAAEVKLEEGNIAVFPLANLEIIA
jgi:hypothetical protein